VSGERRTIRADERPDRTTLARPDGPKTAIAAGQRPDRGGSAKEPAAPGAWWSRRWAFPGGGCRGRGAVRRSRWAAHGRSLTT